MRSLQLTPRLAATVLAATISLPAGAGPGHEHGDAPEAPVAAASPRFEVVSDLFELVGIVDGSHLTLYLDRAEDNAPVPDAKLEVELGGTRLDITQAGPGVFEARLPAEPAPGATPVSAVVTAAGETDRLEGVLEVHRSRAVPEAPTGGRTSRLASPAGTAAAAIALLAVFGWASRRRSSARLEGDVR